jgi:sarcosine oxidase subunit alpha
VFTLRVSTDGETGVPGLFGAGEVTGAMDGARAVESGRRAGEAAR